MDAKRLIFQGTIDTFVLFGKVIDATGSLGQMNRCMFFGGVPSLNELLDMGKYISKGYEKA